MSYTDFLLGRHRTADGVDIVYRDSGGEGAPVVLLHGWPQHSLMWHTIAPRIAATGRRVICPDLRGSGASAIMPGGYDKATMAGDVHDLVAALFGTTPIDLAGYDLGAGVAAAYATRRRDGVRRLSVMEFGLAGFGFEQMMAPTREWTTASNWHLALMSVPDAAEWLFRGREREMLSWFFWHLSHAGGQVAPEHFEAYLQAVSRPGALRAGINYYASVWQDADDNAVLKDTPLTVPVLAIGGEASSGPALEMIWSSVMRDLRTHVVPRAGHWLGDENPDDVADALIGFFGHGS